MESVKDSLASRMAQVWQVGQYYSLLFAYREIC